MHKIVDTILREDGLVEAMQPRMVNDETTNFQDVRPEGPSNFIHDIKIEYSCTWRQEWKRRESVKEVKSKSYPFLFKGARDV